MRRFTGSIDPVEKKLAAQSNIIDFTGNGTKQITGKKREERRLDEGGERIRGETK